MARNQLIGTNMHLEYVFQLGCHHSEVSSRITMHCRHIEVPASIPYNICKCNIVNIIIFETNLTIIITIVNDISSRADLMRWLTGKHE